MRPLIKQVDNILEVKFPRFPNINIINKIKALPYDKRAWSREEDCWKIDASLVDSLSDILGFSVKVERNKLGSENQRTTLDLHFISQPIRRVGGDVYSCGFHDQKFIAVLELSVLEEWYKWRPCDVTLYTSLCIERTASQDEIKKAYRRVARQWHPDVVGESEKEVAHNMFIMINRAYEILSNDIKRRKYDAALLMLPKPDKEEQPMRFLPYRCGRLVCDAEVSAKIKVTKIYKWDDITNDQGQIMCATWKKGDATYETIWG